MKKSKDSLMIQMETSPPEEVTLPMTTNPDAIVEVEDGLTFISEVVVIEDATVPDAVVINPSDPGLVPENCQFCGARNLIDIRRSYYCVNCNHETSK